MKAKIASILLAAFSCTVLADNAALVVIDMQAEFATCAGFHTRPENRAKLNRVVQRQIELIRVAKQNRMPVVIVEYVATGPINADILREVVDYPLAQTFVKPVDGMFSSARVAAQINSFLDRQHVTDLVMSGANGGFCVRCSIEGALRNGYKVWADPDAIIELNDPQFVLPYAYKKGDLRVDPSIVSINFSQNVADRLDLMTVASGPIQAATQFKESGLATKLVESCTRFLQNSVLWPFRNFFSV